MCGSAPPAGVSRAGQVTKVFLPSRYPHQAAVLSQASVSRFRHGPGLVAIPPIPRLPQPSRLALPPLAFVHCSPASSPSLFLGPTCPTCISSRKPAQTPPVNSNSCLPQHPAKINLGVGNGDTCLKSQHWKAEVGRLQVQGPDLAFLMS